LQIINPVNSTLSVLVIDFFPFGNSTIAPPPSKTSGIDKGTFNLDGSITLGGQSICPFADKERFPLRLDPSEDPRLSIIR
jgi:hypothetical protein